MACPEAPTTGIGCACVGPVKSPESCIIEADITHCHCQTPTNNDKGSINDGGGGGGGGSGCGSPSPCGSSKKCCGGCGKKCKSCGKKKECGGEKVVVTFVDVQNKPIDASKVKMPQGSEPFLNPQKIDKGGTPIIPWTGVDELKTNSPYYYTKFATMIDSDGNGQTHYQWNPDPSGVQQNMTTVCQLRALQEDQTGGDPYDDNIDGETYDIDNDDIQDFVDTSESEFNSFIHDCNDNMDATTDTMTMDNVSTRSINWKDDNYKGQSKYIPGILDILLEIENKDDVCTDIKTFENIKKSLLNIKSTFSHVTRMLFNMDLEDVRSDIAKYIYELHVKEEAGENLIESVKEFKRDIRDKLIDLHLDNLDALVDYRNSFDKYINDLVKLFPTETDRMNLIKQKKEIFDSYVDDLVKEDPETKYPLLG